MKCKKTKVEIVAAYDFAQEKELPFRAAIKIEQAAVRVLTNKGTQHVLNKAKKVPIFPIKLFPAVAAMVDDISMSRGEESTERKENVCEKPVLGYSHNRAVKIQNTFIL